MTAPLDVLRKRFIASALATLERSRVFADRLDADPLDAGVLEALRRDLHRLAGSAGSYGFPEASEALARMEQRVSHWCVDATLERDDRAAHLRRLLNVVQPLFGAEGHAPDHALAREVWCVDPPARRVVEWSRLAPSAGVRFLVVTTSEYRERIRRRERPYAVIAPADVGRAIRVPEGLPLVLLADDRHVLTPMARSFGSVTTVHESIDPDDLAVVIERLAQRTSVMGGSVAVLDDDPMILVLVRAICEDAGMRALTIADPNDLLKLLADERPGVLLMDVQLPGTTGFELTRRLRADHEWAELPVVLFSADASAQARELAMEAGADGFLAKPVAPTELRTQLQARLEQVRQLRLASGVNPATGLPEREVGLHHAEHLFGAMRREGGAVGAAVIRLRDHALDARWPHACAHIARALRDTGAAVAHCDDGALAATYRGGYDPIQRALLALRATEPDNTPWVVGFAEASVVGAPNPEDLWLAATDAAEMALADGELMHAWTLSDSRRVPDVIIVEDDQSFAELLEYALRLEGYTFTVLHTGPEALEALRTMRVGSFKPLVLLDLDLPGLDGHAIHERVRVERPNDFVFVFVSVHAGDADQVRALRAGALDYLAKPMSLRVLLSKLPRWVRQPRSAR